MALKVLASPPRWDYCEPSRAPLGRALRAKVRVNHPVSSLRSALISLCLLGFPSPALGVPPTANLAKPAPLQTSPFLARAEAQPVEWRSFGPEAFREARRKQRLIFLSIGASWCHWCHEMGRESFEDPALASLINERFIPVIVDRDLEPVVDRRYQRVVLTLSGRGGWPLTAVLTPDGEQTRVDQEAAA